MRGGVIAAGHGERLAAAGLGVPKPLVSIAGRTLIERALDGLRAAGVSRVACIVNEESGAVATYCHDRVKDLAMTFVVRTTPSSMESLFTIAPLLHEPGSDDPFLVTTVDTIVAPAAVADFARTALRSEDADGVLALTSFVDDEKPLHAACAADGRLVALGAEAGTSATVTAGFYLFRPPILAEVAAARAAGFTALRQFLGHLLARGYRLYGERVPKCVDVDRPEDLVAAEAFVRGGYSS
ncbi:MAG TPA: NDP-sugar synthase [Candidatus Binatia bacterium]|nr:NDP-sugar synthase [Candidatus Binatia bacterium]